MISDDVLRIYNAIVNTLEIVVLCVVILLLISWRVHASRTSRLIGELKDAAGRAVDSVIAALDELKKRR